MEKKVIAAMVGVLRAYAEAEEAQEEVVAVRAESVPGVTINVWGMAGRQEIMLQRKLWQMRLY